MVIPGPGPPDSQTKTLTQSRSHLPYNWLLECKLLMSEKEFRRVRLDSSLQGKYMARILT